MAQQQQFIPATMAPDMLARQLKLQQTQQAAQMLLDQGNQPLKGEMVSGHYVAPAWSQQASKALSQALGMRALSDLPRQQMDMQQAQQQAFARAFGLGGGSQQPQQQAQQPEGAAQAFPVGPSGQQPMPQGQPMGQQQQPQEQPMYPLLPGRSKQESYLIASQIGLPAYMKLAAEQGFQKPVSVAPGGSLVNPQTGEVSYTAPQNGIQVVNGRAMPVQGYSELAARNAGMETSANERARAEYDLVDVPDGRGGTVKMPRSQAIQALGQQGQGQAGGAQQGQLGQTPNPDLIKALQNLPQLQATTDISLNVIDKALADHPGKRWVVGFGSYAPAVRGTPQADYQAMVDQIKGQAFLQGFESLKGGGAITEIEGKKAEEAQARLNTAQTPEAFDEALRELRTILTNGLARAQQKAGVEAPKAQPNFSSGDFSSLWGN